MSVLVAMIQCFMATVFAGLGLIFISGVVREISKRRRIGR